MQKAQGKGGSQRKGMMRRPLKQPLGTPFRNW